MEPGVGAGNAQEESAARYEKRRGFATTKGEDYEVALCCLIFLRALRLSNGGGDFFLASNHDLAGIFDDVVLFYRLRGDQGPEYRAILLQAKHRERITKKRLTLSNPFSLQDYLKSFKEIRRHWEHPLKVGVAEIQFKEIILVLYTNTGCEIGEAAVDVPNFPQVQHLEEFLNTGGRLLRISDGQRLGLPQGRETSDFLSQSLLCTEQMSVDAANGVLEEELCGFFKVTSPEVARELRRELQRVVKDWWGEEGKVRYLTAQSGEWNEVLQMQITRLNRDTINIDRQLDVEFTQGPDVVPPLGLRWIRVRDEHQAKAVRSRLFRTLRNSLVIGVKLLDDHLEEVEALWRNNTLVLDMSAASPEEASPAMLLRRLQEAAVQSGAGRRLVVIAEGKPTSGGWSEADAEPTWSALQQVTRDRLLAAPVRLQGVPVALRDVLGGGGGSSSHVSDVMTDDVISSLCGCETEMKLGAAMPAPLEYNLPRCLLRTSSRTVSVETLTNTNILTFSSNNLSQVDDFTKLFVVIDGYRIKAMSDVKYPTIVERMTNDYDIRQVCCRFRVRGIVGDVSINGLQGDIKEFIPFTWTCEEKIVVVEGPPGVGKSSFVTVMCSSVKEQFPEAWVLRLDMGRHAEYIKETDFTEVSHIMELLMKGLTSLERQLLEHSLSVTGNVFLFLDAFDEISPDLTSKCCDLLRGIAQRIRYRQMVVTTRPVTTEDVEEALQTKAFTLPVFNIEEQNIFLKQFAASKGKEVDRKEMFSLLQIVGPALEIPLLCRMAAEVFLHRREQFLLKCQNPWRRVLLYQVFVEQSVMDRVAEKLELDISMIGLKMLLESHKNSHLQNLQGLAVRKLMPEAQLPPLSVSRATPEEKLGLVLNTGGRLDFEHQTFAEYFLGCWLACHWRDCPPQLLRDVLLRRGLQFVVSTLSWSLFKDLPPLLAVAQGDADAVRKHLSASGTTTTTDGGGRSALHVAAMTKDGPRKLWDLLMASGGEDLNRKDDVLGATAVKYAEFFSNWEFVDLGLQNGARIDDLKFVTVEESAREVVVGAVESDLVCLCEFILLRYPNTFENVYLLHLAAANNSTHVVKLLIGIGYQFNALNKSGSTPLHEASIRGHVEAVKLLAEGGADVDVKDQFGSTALMCAASGGHLEAVKTLLERGADVNVKNSLGHTPLTEAARGGNLEVVKTVLKEEPDLDAMLTEAAFGGHAKLVMFLLEQGADVNTTTEDGRTALTRAARLGHLEVVKVLLERGADVNVKTNCGFTAISRAACGGHLEVVEALLERGADLDTRNRLGHTALMEAARRGRLQVVEALVQSGTDVNVKNRRGETALILADKERYREVVDFLRGTVNRVLDENLGMSEPTSRKMHTT